MTVQNLCTPLSPSQGDWGGGGIVALNQEVLQKSLSPTYIIDTTTTNKEQHDGTMVPFLSRNIATQNGVGMVQIIARRAPLQKGPPHDKYKKSTKGRVARQRNVIHAKSVKNF